MLHQCIKTCSIKNVEKLFFGFALGIALSHWKNMKEPIYGKLRDVFALLNPRLIAWSSSHSYSSQLGIRKVKYRFASEGKVAVPYSTCWSRGHTWWSHAEVTTMQLHPIPHLYVQPAAVSWPRAATQQYKGMGFFRSNGSRNEICGISRHVAQLLAHGNVWLLEGTCTWTSAHRMGINQI